MRLSDFIQQHHDQIIGEWVKFAATLLPWAKGLSERSLKDHAEELLDAVVADMKAPQSSAEKSQKSKGLSEEGALGRIGQKHAAERLESGLSLDQLVAEYRALRASVLRLWEEEQGDKQGEVTRFNEAIDETLGKSTARYAQTVNTTREQFLGILGHDLRNPLNAITVGASLLTRSESLDDKQSRTALRIFNSAERMTRMVNDLLDLTRTRLGSGIPVMPRPLDLAEVCQSVIAELQVVHPDCEVRFEQQGDLRGEWDGDRLTQVISNLVANALQHGGAHAVVTVAASAEGEQVQLQVQNPGTPIPEEVMKHIFEPMVQHKASTEGPDRNASGLGLGLYIAQEVVTAHGGSIKVSSTKQEGTRFTVKLPRHPVKKRPQSETF